MSGLWYCPQDYYTSRMGVMLVHVAILIQTVLAVVPRDCASSVAEAGVLYICYACISHIILCTSVYIYI